MFSNNGGKTMKRFEVPMMRVVQLTNEDVITASCGQYFCTEYGTCSGYICNDCAECTPPYNCFSFECHKYNPA